MILVTQGHEKGIGLEVFIKSFLCLPKNAQSKFILYCNKTTLIETLLTLHIPLISLSQKLKISFIDNSLTQTLDAINKALNDIKSSDILLTLPSSKDQFIFNDVELSGHTEYFRSLYNDKNIVMSFISNDLNLLLLTDHIQLSNVGTSLNVSMISEKVSLFLNKIDRIRTINTINFSGINPHNGENGMMGDEDNIINEAINKLKNNFKTKTFNGPIAGDTLFFSSNSSDILFVYAYHDQGLTVFKQHNGLQGINLTLGLPFIRVSPDHGTAFNLYGKGSANYLGMNYLLNEILKW